MDSRFNLDILFFFSMIALRSFTCVLLVAEQNRMELKTALTESEKMLLDTVKKYELKIRILSESLEDHRVSD